jgi:polyisoprenoid-binding protein YceI
LEQRGNNIFAKLIKGLLKIFLGITLSVFLLFFLIAGAVQVPFVQNFLVQKITAYATTFTGYEISIEGIHIDWFDVIVLEEAVLWDKHESKMIYLGEAEVDYTIISLFQGKIDLDNVTLRDGEVNLIKYEGEEVINISGFIATIQELTKPKVKREKPPMPIKIPKVTLDNMLFSYHNRQMEPMTEVRFDHNHFTLDSIQGTVTNLYIVLDTIQLNAHKLRTNLRNSHLRVKELTTAFLLDRNQIRCAELDAKIGDSELREYFRFSYNNISELSEFNDKVTIDLRLNKAQIAIRDIAHFAPPLAKIKDKILISTIMNGRVKRFSLDSLDMNFGKVSHLKGKMRFDGLPNIQETFMDINLAQINVQAQDLVPYTGAVSGGVLDKFGIIKGRGAFLGFVNDFAVEGAFNTSLGSLVSDINLKIDDKNKARSFYKGSLKTTAFDLGQLLNEPLIQKVDMNGSIEGKGFTMDAAEMNLKAEITRLGINNYDYHNIVTNARLSGRFFDGDISITDSNLVLKADGRIDMRNKPEVFDIQGSIEKANLEDLNITGFVTQVITNFDLDFTGTDLDSIVGTAVLNNTYLLYRHKDVFIRSLALDASKEEDYRRIKLTSDMVDANMNGVFQVKELISDAQMLFKELKLFYEQDRLSLNQYYAQKKPTERKAYKSEFDVNIKNINNLLDLYYPGVYVSNNTLLEGEFGSGTASRFNFHIGIDSFFYKGNEFYKNDIEFAVSKLTDSSDVLAMTYVSSDVQNYNNSLKSENFFAEGRWSDSTIAFTTSIAQQGNNNKIFLNGALTIQDTFKQLVFARSYIDIAEDRWVVSDSNSIHITENDLRFNLMKIYNKNQSILVRGDFSEDESKQATVFIRSFQLNNLDPLINYQLKGIADGMIKVRNVYKELDLSGNMHIKALTIDNFIFGDLLGKADWNENEKQLNVNIDVTREKVKVINVAGNIKPTEDKSSEVIDLIAQFNAADLGVITPVLKGVMSDISGTVNGKLNITGSFSDIHLKGEADVTNGKFKIDFLGSPYTFNDKIYFADDQIRFKNMVLTDAGGNKGRINGGIYYDGFRNFLVDLKGDFRNFNVLNIPEKDATVFYGNANVTGDFSLFGPFTDLEIRANARTEKDTRIYIPLSSSSDVAQKEYIHFVTIEEKEKPQEAAKKDSLKVNSGIRMFFNMEITPDAYAELIFDKRTGDIIRGKGEGNIQLRYDTRGDMNMYGTYTIQEGHYNFTMASLISKEFVIDRGSRITWNGAPYDGTLDIKAKYHQYVSLRPLIIDSTLKASPDLQRSYPTDVLLGISGNLMSPEIVMDIDILRYPNDPTVSTIVTDFEAKIKTNDQELNRQVFSLILLQRFMEPNTFTGVSGGASNVSELLSSQLSQFLSQVDQNLEVDVNLKNFDKDALNTFRLRLSYTMMDGRLRITRDGNFQNVQSSQQANISNIAGEWTVEYLLSEDGKFRMKLFNKINSNSLLTSLNSTSTSAGFSLMHTQSFDTLKELFTRKKKRREQEEEDEKPLIPFDESEPEKEEENK